MHFLPEPGPATVKQLSAKNTVYSHYEGDAEMYCSLRSHLTTGGQVFNIYYVKGSLCFVVKLALPPFSPLTPLEYNFHNKAGTEPLTS